MRFRRVSSRAFLLAVSLLFAGHALAQATAPEISAKWAGKVLFLRGMWIENRLQFRADGQPVKSYAAESFAEAGFLVESVKLEGSILKLEGPRVVLAFAADESMKVVPLKGSGWRIKIEIQGTPGEDFGPALTAIFTPELKDLEPAMPDYWQRWFERKRSPPLVQQATTPGIVHAGAKGLKPPHVEHAPDPDFSAVGRSLRYQGNVQVYLQVDEKGHPEHVSISKPVGMGLDEKAVESVEHFRFSPALQDGKPVKVDLYINVNFQLF